jgi:hypothetical protein
VRRLLGSLGLMLGLVICAAPGFARECAKEGEKEGANGPFGLTVEMSIVFHIDEGTPDKVTIMGPGGEFQEVTDYTKPVHICIQKEHCTDLAGCAFRVGAIWREERDYAGSFEVSLPACTATDCYKGDIYAGRVLFARSTFDHGKLPELIRNHCMATPLYPDMIMKSYQICRAIYRDRALRRVLGQKWAGQALRAWFDRAHNLIEQNSAAVRPQTALTALADDEELNGIVRRWLAEAEMPRNWGLDRCILVRTRAELAGSKTQKLSTLAGVLQNRALTSTAADERLRLLQLAKRAITAANKEFNRMIREFATTTAVSAGVTEQSYNCEWFYNYPGDKRPFSPDVSYYGVTRESLASLTRIIDAALSTPERDI